MIYNLGVEGRIFREWIDNANSYTNYPQIEPLASGEIKVLRDFSKFPIFVSLAVG